MFDQMFAGLDEAALIAAIEQAAREEAQAGARKLAAIAELVACTVDQDDERNWWAFDPWNNTAAAVGAALSVGQRRASGQMRIAVALRDRLPRVGALFCDGLLSSRLISEITWRTQLVEDADVLALLDAAVAEGAVGWGPLSDVKLVRAIEAVIERFDAEAVRRAQEVIRTRDLHIGASEDPHEITALWGRLLACDAAALEARVTAMVKGVCDNDPRSVGERRADALGAFAHGNEHLACRCGAVGCPAAGSAESRVVIRVIADQAAVDAAKDLIATQDRRQQAKNTERAKPAESKPAEPKPAESEPPESKRSPCPKDSGVALLAGVHVLPIVALAEAIRGGAAITPLWLPGPDPEPHYRPSAKLAEFIRTRDVFCRFPGCDVPAERCDIDHVVPYPWGPTHASNMNCKCRTHHVGKTFWDGWRDVQLPDGTVIWTTPNGQTYTTMPGSRLFFPTWNTTTAELAPMAQPPPDPDRAAKMPRRRRTRAADTAARIKAERALNNSPDPPPAWRGT